MIRGAGAPLAGTADTAHRPNSTGLFMKRCILHFGMHKTGSSSIQESLFHAPRIEGARYISLGHANASGSLQLAFVDGGAGKLNRRLGLADTHLERKNTRVLSLLEKGLRGGGSRFILSGESLSHFKEHELQRLIDAIRPHVDVIEAVGYIRDARGFIESAFQQHVRAGYARKWQPEKLYPQYRRSFEKFDKLLGPENVQFWPFEPTSFPGGDVVQDFCQRLQITIPAEALKRVNEGLSGDAVRLMWTFRRHGLPHLGAEDQLERQRRLLERMANLKGSRIRFAPALLAPVLDAQRADLDWMEARLGRSLSRLGEAQDGDVRSEDDLQSCSNEGLRWLAEQLGDPPPGRLAAPGPKEIARRMFRLWGLVNGDEPAPVSAGDSQARVLQQELQAARKAAQQARRAARGKLA